MAKKGKKYTQAVEKIDRAKLYDAPEALGLVAEIATAKFDETVEAHIKLGVDGRHADQQVRGAIVLPHGTGKTKKVLVFAKGEKAAEAQAGAVRHGLAGAPVRRQIPGAGFRGGAGLRRYPERTDRRLRPAGGHPLGGTAGALCHEVELRLRV